MSTVSDQLGKQAKEVIDDLQTMGVTVRDAAQERLGDVGQRVTDYCEQGRDSVNSIVDTCERFFRQRPLVSVLMAAGIGLLLGRVWKGR